EPAGAAERTGATGAGAAGARPEWSGRTTPGAGTAESAGQSEFSKLATERPAPESGRQPGPTGSARPERAAGPERPTRSAGPTGTAGWWRSEPAEQRAAGRWTARKSEPPTRRRRNAQQRRNPARRTAPAGATAVAGRRTTVQPRSPTAS